MDNLFANHQCIRCGHKDIDTVFRCSNCGKMIGAFGMDRNTTNVSDVSVEANITYEKIVETFEKVEAGRNNLLKEIAFGSIENEIRKKFLEKIEINNVEYKDLYIASIPIVIDNDLPDNVFQFRYNDPELNRTFIYTDGKLIDVKRISEIIKQNIDSKLLKGDFNSSFEDFLIRLYKKEY